MHCNLFQHMQVTHFRGLPLADVREIGRQLLESLSVLASMREPIIHCDLKPENVLLTSANSLEVRLADFGSACRRRERMVKYVQSRFYRSPEVLMGLSYTEKVDMWSLGCLLYELYTGHVLFQGTSSSSQMRAIRSLLGLPPKSLLYRMAPAARHELFGTMSSPPPPMRATLMSLFRKKKSKGGAVPSADLLADENSLLNVLQALLVYEPSKRLKPAEALAMPFFQAAPAAAPSPAPSLASTCCRRCWSTSHRSASSPRRPSRCPSSRRPRRRRRARRRALRARNARRPRGATSGWAAAPRAQSEVRSFCG